MTTIDWHPSPKKLKQFGWVSLIGFGLFGVIFPLGIVAAGKAWPWPLSIAFWALGLATWLLSLISHRAVRPIYLAWTTLTFPIGWAISHLAMATIYFLVLTPIALLLRLAGRNPLQRQKKEAPTYWHHRPPRPAPDRYTRQF